MSTMFLTAEGIPTDLPDTPITIFDLAVERGMKVADDGSCSGQDFYDVGLEILGGCGCCGASIAAYNAYPSKGGYWCCKDCIGDTGWMDATAANAEIFGTDDPDQEIQTPTTEDMRYEDGEDNDAY